MNLLSMVRIILYVLLAIIIAAAAIKGVANNYGKLRAWLYSPLLILAGVLWGPLAVLFIVLVIIVGIVSLFLPSKDDESLAMIFIFPIIGLFMADAYKKKVTKK